MYKIMGFIVITFFRFWFCLWDGIFLQSAGWPRTFNPPASTAWEMGPEVSITVFSYCPIFMHRYFMLCAYSPHPSLFLPLPPSHLYTHPFAFCFTYCFLSPFLPMRDMLYSCLFSGLPFIWCNLVPFISLKMTARSSFCSCIEPYCINGPHFLCPLTCWQVLGPAF